jgi:hypothetical protein
MSFEVDDLVLFIEVKALPTVGVAVKGEDEVPPNNDVFVSVVLLLLLLPNTDDGDDDDAPPKAANDDGVLLLLLLAPKTDVEGVLLLTNADTNDDFVVLVALSALARLPKVAVAFVLVLVPKPPPIVAAVDDGVVKEDNGDVVAILLDPPVSSNADLEVVPPIELTDPKVAAVDVVAVAVLTALLAKLPKPVVVVVFPKPPL